MFNPISNSISDPISIPIINLHPLIHGTLGDRQTSIAQLDRACREIGFLYLKQCGIHPKLWAQMFEQSRQFFALPETTKQQLAWTTAANNRGYGSTGRERLNPERPGDFKETFNIGTERPADDSSLNRWPADLPNFRTTALAFFEASAQVADQVLTGLAIALDLPTDFFTSRHNQHPFTLRLLHYPPLAQPLAPGQLRAGEHTDYGTITLLFQDAVGGLDVQTRTGDWVAAPPIPDTVLVNLGDLMQRWINHTYCSTRHRVMPPAAGQLGQSRYSIALFCDANPAVEVACLPSCQSATNPPRYPAISAQDYLLSRLRSTY